MHKRQGGWVIVLSFVAAFLLTIVPLPVWLNHWRPAWIAVVLMYWCLALPQRVGVGSGWAVGIAHDLMSDTLLGEHAVSYALLAYITVSNYHTVRMFPIRQQALGLFGLVVLSEVPGLWVRGMLGYGFPGWSILYPALTSMILWRWVFVLLRDLRRSYRVSG